MFIARLMHLIMIGTLSLVSFSVIGGCAEAKATVDVSVHGVNYSGATFSYYLIDPVNPDTGGVGETIDPFAGGGTTCCFSLPKIWRPGIKVQIHATHWLPRPDGSLSEEKNVHIVDVPRYDDNKPGELWVMRGADGNMSVISSDFQPDHPKWPGKIKGWPIPSLEYRRERWELVRKHEQGGVETYLALIDEIEKTPLKSARESWAVHKEYEPKTLRDFSGPDDPRYTAYLKERYKTGLLRSREMLKRVMDAKP